MEHKKKYLGKLSFLFGLLFCLLLGFSSTTCYAGVSFDYIKYAVGNLKDNYHFYDNVSTFKSYATSLYNDDTKLANITDTLNTFLSDNNISNLSDVNCIVLYGETRYKARIVFTFSNCGAPNGLENLGFLSIFHEGVSRFGCKGDTNDKIYAKVFDFDNSSFTVTGTYVVDNGNNINSLYYISDANYNNDFTVYTSQDISCAGIPWAYVGYPKNYYTNLYYMNLVDGSGNYQLPTPPQPSGDIPSESGDIVGSGDIGSSSGDSGSNIDYTSILGDINNNITTQGQNIVNQISGDTQKITNSIDNLNNTLTSGADMDSVNITSGDILENFSFMADPYSNFWWDFIDGVELALLGSVRQLPVNWLGYNGYFNLDGFINYPTPIKNILSAVSTVCVVWIMLKWWKVIMDKLTSGDIDEVLEIVEEQGRVNITNLF